MEKNKIEEELRKKFDDAYTIKMFTNFVIEFQECFSDIVPTEEVIARMKANIFGNIKIIEKFDNEKLDGKYAYDGIIYLKKEFTTNEKYTKYLLFHELLHAITSIRDEYGKEIMLGFSYLKNSYGMGLNEAMTEYLTQIRNEKFETDRKDLISGYRTVVEQIRRLINILGKKEILHYYFYEPDKFKDYINRKGMNYEEIEFAFRDLCGKDNEVYNMGHGKKLHNNNNYTIQRNSRMIFNNFSRALGEINTLEDFENKYRIFQTYTDGNHDCIITMYLAYYNSMGKDVDKLLKNGVNFNEIKEILNRLHISLDVLKNMYNVSKLFVQDKNQTATSLYNLYKKNPSFYLNIFAQNYGYIFDYFREMDANPDKSIYDAFRYPIIGVLLKEHPQIDFSEVSYYKIDEDKSKIHCYLFSTSDSKIYGYTIDGKQIRQFKDTENNDIFEIKMNEFCTCQFIYSKSGKINYSINSTNGFDLENYMKDVEFISSYTYSEKSDIEWWIDENGKNHPELFTYLKKINDRINTRQGRTV